MSPSLYPFACRGKTRPGRNYCRYPPAYGRPSVGGPEALKRVGIVPNTQKPEAIAGAARLVRELEARGVQVLLTQEGARPVGRPDLAAPFPVEHAGVELVVVLGGDGTLLRAAKAVAPLGLPVLGVNTGHLGFLTEFEEAELWPELDEILAGHWQVEKRMMLRARIVRDGVEIENSEALNDVVVTRGPLARMVHFTAEVAGVPVAEYAADGLIVATPTGSTAYSLSAGGPIVHPGQEVFLLTPICPHTFNARSLVLPATETIAVRMLNRSEVVLTIDGQPGGEFEPGDVLLVERAPEVARLVRRHTFRFYDVLRRKLSEPSQKIGTSFTL